MGGGPRVRDDVSRAIIEETRKTRDVAEKLGLTDKGNKLFTFVDKAISKAAEPYNTGPIQTEPNPAITAFQRTRDRVSTDSRPVKTVEEYIKRLSQEYRKEMDQVKKQEKMKSQAKPVGAQLSQYWNPEPAESPGRQQTSIPALIKPRTHEV